MAPLITSPQVSPSAVSAVVLGSLSLTGAERPIEVVAKSRARAVPTETRRQGFMWAPVRARSRVPAGGAREAAAGEHRLIMAQEGRACRGRGVFGGGAG